MSAALVSGLECRRDGRWLWVCESVRGRCVRPDRKRGLGLAAWYTSIAKLHDVDALHIYTPASYSRGAVPADPTAPHPLSAQAVLGRTNASMSGAANRQGKMVSAAVCNLLWILDLRRELRID